MRKFTFSFKSLLVAAGLLLGSANAWAATETLSGADATTKDTPIAKTSFTVLSTYNPNGSLEINKKSCLKVRWKRSDASTGSTNGFALKVNSGYKITGITAQMSGNGADLVLADIKVDGTSYSGDYSKTLTGSTGYTNITLSGIEATNYINFEYSSGGGDATQGYVYITVTYEERIVAREVYNFEGWTTADGVISQATGEGTTFDVTGVDEDGTRNMVYASHITIGGIEHSFGNRIAFDNYSNGSSFGWRFRNTGSTYQKGLVTQGKSPNWSPYYFSICNLNVGDVVKVTYNYQSTKDAQPYFVSTNASVGGVAVVANTTKMVSGTEYTITAAGHLDLVVKNNNFGMHKLEIIRVVASKVESAIADIKSCENSRAFAAYIDDLYDKGSLTKESDVYAAHTNWQIAQAEAASSNDITKVIIDAQVSDFTRWNNARNNSGQQYSGAPDDKYFDGWDNQASNAKQKIYGLPAGTYMLKAATRASVELTEKSKYNVWISGGSANVSVLGNHIGAGAEDGELGNGWSWTVLPFTLSENADVEIGFYALPGEGTGLWAGCDDFHLYKVTSVTATIGSTGYTTFASPYALNLSGMTASEGTVTAFYASASDASSVTMTSKTATVAAGEGLLLKGTVGATITIPVVASGDAISGNKLVGCTTSTALSANANYWVLVNNGGKAEFQNLAENGATIPEGKAYLDLTAGSGVKALGIVFAGDTATGVEAPVAAEATVEDGIYYNLNGQQVTKDYKGIVIVNGKKFYNK